MKYKSDIFCIMFLSKIKVIFTLFSQHLRQNKQKIHYKD